MYSLMKIGGVCQSLCAKKPIYIGEYGTIVKTNTKIMKLDMKQGVIW